MKTESEFPSVYQDFLCTQGIPSALRHDNAKHENSATVKEINCNLIVEDLFTEPHHPHQNPAEGSAIKWLKTCAEILQNKTGSPDNLWFLLQKCLTCIHNSCAHPTNNWQIPNQVSGGAQLTFPTFCNFTGVNLCCALILWQNSQKAKRNLDILLDLQKTLEMQ